MSESVRYSLCATHYNNYGYLPESVGVIAEKISDKQDWELVITDADSDDGSLEYLREVSERHTNVHLHIEPGANIGEGRRLAAQYASGDILFQLTDLDAEYHTDDRIFEIMELFETKILPNDAALTGCGAYIMSADLLEEIGGWRDLPVAEERDMGRRLLREDKLYFIEKEVYKSNAGSEKGGFSKYKRAVRNWAVKLQSGVSLRHLLRTYLSRGNVEQATGALLVAPIAWVTAKRSGQDYETYDADDPYVLNFGGTAKDRHPNLILDFDNGYKKEAQ